MELNKRKQFSKEQLINLTRDDVEFWQERNELIPSMHTSMRLYQAEIALAALTAPNDVPRSVLDGICYLSDGGVNAQAIWKLCKAAVMGRAQ